MLHRHSKLLIHTILAVVILLSLYRSAIYVSGLWNIGGATAGPTPVTSGQVEASHTRTAVESIARMREHFAEEPPAVKEVDEQFYRDKLAQSKRLDEISMSKEWTDEIVDEIISCIFPANPIKLSKQEMDTLLPAGPAARARHRAYSLQSSRTVHAVLILFDRVERGTDRQTHIDARLRKLILDNMDNWVGTVMSSYLAYDDDMIARVRTLAASTKDTPAKRDAIAAIKKYDLLGDMYHEKSRKRLAAIRARWAAGASR